MRIAFKICPEGPPEANMKLRRTQNWTMSGIALILSGALALGARAEAGGAILSASERLNVVLITADDMQYDSLGVTGCKLKDITPNLDKLASEGMLFERAHVTVAVCQPSRSVLMTGRYPFHNGALGFEPIRRDVPTLGESLRTAGYLNGIFAKVEHLAPREKFCWDVVVQGKELGEGRDPALYAQWTKTFIEKAKAANKPFFLMANSQDPHRPFAPIEDQPDGKPALGTALHPSRIWSPKEVDVPCFLPDLPPVRREVAQYYTSVHRCDETIGQILRTLDEAGVRDTTLVMFLSDNGMAFPFAKTNCYPFSTHTPWIVRWPGKVKPGGRDTRHFISGIDFMPTVLDALHLSAVCGMDGRSFLNLLRRDSQSGRDSLVTVFHQTVARRNYPMRCRQTADYAYIYNAWSDGKTVFQNESTGSPTFKAMKQVATSNSAVAERVNFLSLRAPEELYDMKKDPYCLRNLASDAAHRTELQRMREQMEKWMFEVSDPAKSSFLSLISTASHPSRE